MARKRGQEGIETRHSKHCVSRQGQKCNCTPTYQAQVWNSSTGRVVKRTFKTLAAAKDWRADARRELKNCSGEQQLPTVREAMGNFIADIRAGKVLNRWRKPYKKSAADCYEADYRLRLDKHIGAKRLDEVKRGLLQRLVDELVAAGLSPSTVNNAIIPLRACFRWYGERHDEFDLDPFKRLKLPVEEEFSFEALPLPEVIQILRAVPLRDKLVWALAYLAGLRIGEIQALRRKHVDLVARLMWIVENYERKKQYFDSVKTDSSERIVPIVELLLPFFAVQTELAVEKFGQEALEPESLVIPGSSLGKPFNYNNFLKRGRKAFKDAGIEWRTPHKGRHNFVSYAIDVLNPRVAADTVGHSQPSFTLKRYSHKIKGAETDARKRLDGLLRAMEEEAEAGEEIRGEQRDIGVEGTGKADPRETLNRLFDGRSTVDSTDGSDESGAATEEGTDEAAEEQNEAHASENDSEDDEA